MTSESPPTGRYDTLSRLRNAFEWKPTLLAVVERLAAEVERNVKLLELMRDHADDLSDEEIRSRHGGADADKAAIVVKAALSRIHGLYLETYEARKQEALDFYDKELKSPIGPMQRFLAAGPDPCFDALRQAAGRRLPTQFKVLHRVLKKTPEQVVALLLSFRQASRQWVKDHPERGPSLFKGDQP